MLSGQKSFSFNKQISVDKQAQSGSQSFGDFNNKTQIGLPEMSNQNSAIFGGNNSEIQSAVMTAANPAPVNLGAKQTGHVSFAKVQHQFTGGHVSFGRQNFMSKLEPTKLPQITGGLALGQQHSLLINKMASQYSNNQRSAKSIKQTLGVNRQQSYLSGKSAILKDSSSSGKNAIFQPKLAEEQSMLSFDRKHSQNNPFGQYLQNQAQRDEADQRGLSLKGMDSLMQFKNEQQYDRIRNEFMKNKRGRKDAYGDNDSLTAYTPPKHLEKSQSDMDHSRELSHNASGTPKLRDVIKSNFDHFKALQHMGQNQQNSGTFGHQESNMTIQRDPRDQNDGQTESAFQQFVPINLTININNFGGGR